MKGDPTGAPTLVMPTRPLVGPGARKGTYVYHLSTDIRKTFEKFRRVESLRERAQKEQK